MEQPSITDRDRAMAQKCVECPVCTHARAKQRGLAFWLVKGIEGGLCPYCRAYERVYGRKAHEPLPTEAAATNAPQGEAPPPQGSPTPSETQGGADHTANP